MGLQLGSLPLWTNNKRAKRASLFLLAIIAYLSFTALKKTQTNHKLFGSPTDSKNNREYCYGGYTHMIFSMLKAETAVTRIPSTNFYQRNLDTGFEFNSNYLVDSKGKKFTNFGLVNIPIGKKVELFNYNYSPSEAEKSYQVNSRDVTFLSWNWPGYVPEAEEKGKICVDGKCFEWGVKMEDMLFDGHRCGRVVRHCVVFQNNGGNYGAVGLVDCTGLAKFGNPADGLAVTNLYLRE
jgi:hypothetical protein